MSGYLSGKRVFYATRAGASPSPGATERAAKVGIARCVPQRIHLMRSAAVKHGFEAVLANETGAMPANAIDAARESRLSAHAAKPTIISMRCLRNA
jgi:hypothetical protein